MGEKDPVRERVNGDGRCVIVISDLLDCSSIPFPAVSDDDEAWLA